MDVSCPKCQTEYELDDSKVTDAGVTVKCTTCAHVFRVKRKQLVVTLPARPDAQATELPPSTSSPDLPPPPPSREWKLRLANGQTVPCRDLTMLQKWIIEAKVHRDDEISLTGDVWKRLGSIPELGSFFQIVEDAARGRAASTTPPPPPPPSVPPAAPSAEEKKKITDTWREPEFSIPPPAPLVPENLPVVQKEVARRTTDDRATARTEVQPQQRRTSQPIALERPPRSSSGWIVLVICGVLLGGALGWYFGIYEPEQRLAAERAAEQARQDEEAREREAAAKADAGAEGVDAGEPDAGADVAAPIEAEDAGTPEVDAGLAVVVDAGTAPVVVPQRRSCDGLVAMAVRLRAREKTAESLDLYAKAHELKPERVEPIAGRGLALMDMANPSGAEQAFEQALALSPRYGPAIMGLAESCRMQGKKDKALQYYQRYLEVLPNGSDAPVARTNIERLKQ